MRALNAMGSALAKAHAQDFQRREPRLDRLETRYNSDEDDDSSHASEDEMTLPSHGVGSIPSRHRYLNVGSEGFQH